MAGEEVAGAGRDVDAVLPSTAMPNGCPGDGALAKTDTSPNARGAPAPASPGLTAASASAPSPRRSRHARTTAARAAALFLPFHGQSSLRVSPTHVHLTLLERRRSADERIDRRRGTGPIRQTFDSVPCDRPTATSPAGPRSRACATCPSTGRSTRTWAAPIAARSASFARSSGSPIGRPTRDTGRRSGSRPTSSRSFAGARPAIVEARPGRRRHGHRPLPTGRGPLPTDPRRDRSAR